MKTLIIIFILCGLSACAHKKPNLQADCASVGKLKDGRVLSDCDQL